MDTKSKDKQEIARLKRDADITKRCTAGGLSDEFARELIESDYDENQINKRMLDEYERVGQQKTSRAYIMPNETTSDVNSIAGSVCSGHRSILEVARSYVSDRSASVADVVSRALTTSDFPKVLSNIANKTLQNAYNAEPQSFRPLVNVTSLKDFKDSLTARFGDAPELLLKLEGGEYKYGGIGEEGESYKLKTYGRIVRLTREAIINDDLNAFTRLIQSQGQSASILESDLFYESFNENRRMADNHRYFSTEHENLLTVTKSDLTIENLSKARKMLMMQKTVDKKFMNLQARYLIVPPDLQTTAEQLVSTNLLAKQVSDINPFSGGLEVITDPRLDNDTSWYIAASNNNCNLFDIAYLNGQDGVYLDSKEQFETDSIDYKCRLDVVLAPVDWRGIVKITK